MTYLPDALPNLDRQALIQNEDETLLRKVIYDAEVKRVKHKIASETEALEAALQEKQQDMTDKLAELSDAFKSTQDKITASTTELESSIKRNEELNNDNHRLNLKIQESKSELDVIIEKSRKVEESMARKVEKLTDFIKEKAIFLKSFEFLDEEDFDFLLEAPCLIRSVVNISLFHKPFIQTTAMQFLTFKRTSKNETSCTLAILSRTS